MARKQLINLHSSVVKHPSGVTLNPDIKIGEIIVQAVETAATIYTKVGDESGNTYAEFIDKAQVQALITGSSASLIERLNTVESGLSSVSGTVDTIEPMAKSALQEVKAAGDTYVTATTNTKSGDEGEKEQTVTVAADVAGALDSVSATGQLADAKYVKDYVDGEISDEATSRSEKDTQLENAITGVSDTVAKGFSGLTIDATHSVKTYVDESISTAVGSVYKVKGTVQTADQLPATASTGDVYNIASQSSYGVAGTNVVWDGAQWDPLGGTFDLSNYATTTALTEESTARSEADDAINAKIGGNYSSSSTVHDAITAVAETAGSALQSVSAAGANDYVSASAATKSNNAQAITVTANVASEFSGVSATGSLADAKQVKDYIDAAVSSANTDLESLEEKVEGIETTLGTYTGKVDTLETTVSGLQSSVLTGATLVGDTYVTGTTSKSGNVETITLNTDVSTDISAETETGKLADAYAVKQYVSEQNDSMSERVTDIENVLGDNTAYTQSNTVTDSLAALEAAAVKSVTVDDTANNKITATKTGNAVALNFDNMVIDCGTY